MKTTIFLFALLISIFSLGACEGPRPAAKEPIAIPSAVSPHPHVCTKQVIDGKTCLVCESRGSYGIDITMSCDWRLP